MAQDKSTKQEVAEDIKIESEEKKNSNKKKDAGSKTKDNKKIKTLIEKNKALEEEKTQLKDQLLRKMAEFENYKRRTEKEFLAYLENANEGLITEILPALDDFERFLEHAEKDETNESLKDGIALIYKKIFEVLEKKGLKVMESTGLEFDAEKHEALVQVDTEEVESGYITAEHRKGYTLNDKVIRHAQVLVAK